MKLLSFLAQDFSNLYAVKDSFYITFRPTSALYLCMMHIHQEPGYIKTNLLFGRFVFGGDERDRTADPLLARQVLSQLSYTPNFRILGLGRTN